MITKLIGTLFLGGGKKANCRNRPVYVFERMKKLMCGCNFLEKRIRKIHATLLSLLQWFLPERGTDVSWVRRR